MSRFILLLFLILLVSAIPFIVAGVWLEPWIENHLLGPGHGKTVAAALVLGTLASDIVLPIPSSAVCTYAGKSLGLTLGTVLCWMGLNISAAIGYGLGAGLGRKAVHRFGDPDTMARLEKMSGTSAALCLVTCRSLPIVAEASVLLMGIRKLPLAEFWPPVLLANLGVAAALCALGAISAEYSFFPFALAISVAVPILFIVVWKWKQ